MPEHDGPVLSHHDEVELAEEHHERVWGQRKGSSTDCVVCGRLTIDVERRVHDRCRPRVGPPVVIPPRDPDSYSRKAKRKPKPSTPAILTPEHEVTMDDLPRGPKAVAKGISEAWTVTWLKVVSEELESPKRGGECYGVKFAHPDGRCGWATWFRGGYQAAFLYRRRGAMVPTKLKAKELKEVLADG